MSEETVDSTGSARGARDDEASRLVAAMTLEEKASLTSGLDFWHTKGIDRLGVESMMMTDGPHGLRKQAAAADHLGLNESVPATCFPTAATLGSTWDPELLREVGAALGEQTAANGVGVVLGPGVNIKRSPLCGRNFEYFSEDPLLTGRLADAYVSGVQSQGVGASLKHFAVNNQETDRMRVDARVDERTLREIYLPAFEEAVKQAKPWTVMCSYNRINGVYASQNRRLLTRILRDEWGFGGLVVSDWGAVDERVAALEAGLDLEMPASGGVTDAQIVEAVHSGRLDIEVLDAAARRVVSLVLASRQARSTTNDVDFVAHHALARRAAAAGTVLLKNGVDNGRPVLPFDAGEFTPEDPLVVIGEFARTPRYQGAGSSQVNPVRLDAALGEFEARLTSGGLVFEPGFAFDGQGGQELRDRAVDAARGRRTVLFLGLPESIEAEGYDREDMDIPAAQIALVRAVHEVARDCTVVLSNGSAVAVDKWQDCCDALLECWLGGEAGGSAVVDVLLGEREPGGRLAESIPERLEQVPAQLNFPGEAGTVRYGEGLFVGYRGLDATGATPSYPFGFGLSYTTFAIDEVAVPSRIDVGERIDDVIGRVRGRITNTGERAGSEVVQLYIGRVGESLVQRVKSALAAFIKVSLEVGEQAVFELPLTRRSFAHWDTRVGDWIVEPGMWAIRVGTHSRDDSHMGECAVVGPARPVVVDRDSTLAEWMEDPLGLEELRVNAPNLIDLAQDPKSGRMMAAMPLIRLASFPGMGLSRRRVDDLLDNVRRRREQPIQ